MIDRRAVLVMTALVAALALAGPARAAFVFPSSKDFGSQAVGTTGSAASFQLQTSPSGCSTFDMFGNCTTVTPNSVNTSELGAPPDTTTTVGDFLVHNVDCDYPTLTSPATWLLSGFCRFEVSFAPTAAGPRSWTFSFPENGGASFPALTISGTGLGPASLTPQRKKCKKRHRAARAAKKKCKKKRR